MDQPLAAIRGMRMPSALPLLTAWAQAEGGRFVHWLPVIMGAGVLCDLGLRTEPAGWIGPVASAASAGLLALLWRSAVGRGAGAVLLAAALGFTAAQCATWRALPVLALPRTAIVLTGQVRGVESLPEGRRVTIEGGVWADQPPLARTLHLRLRPDDAVVLAAGDTIQVRTLLRPPASPAYPGAWDLQFDAYFSGLAGSANALGPATVVAHARPEGGAWLQGVRDRIASRLLAGLPGAEGAIAATLLTGSARAVPAADRAAFRDSGLAHLLAVAGLHIGIVMGFAMMMARTMLALSTRAALFWPCKPIAAGAAWMAGAGYLLLTGAHVPILRSFAMASLVTLGIALDRPAISLRALAVAATVLLLLAPYEAMGVGFQMSFAAVLALIAGYEALKPVLQRLNRPGLRWRILRHLSALVLTSLLAGIASAPYGAYHFGHIQAYFILSNLVAVPITAALVMPAGLAALALMPWGLEHAALVPMGWGIGAVLWLARSVAALPAATIAVPHMPGWGLAVTSLGLAWLGLWRTRMRLAGAVAIVAGLLSGVASPPADMLVSDDARLIALDGTRLQTRPGYAPFVRDAWAQYWAAPVATPFPEDGAPGAVRCDPDGCRIARGGAVVLLARSLRPMACAGASLVVSAEPARDICPGVPLIDRFTVWREGAQAVWFTAEGVTILSDRAARGTRPWVPAPPAPSRRPSSLPMAAAETLPDAP